MAANINPTVRRRRLGAELRRLRMASGLKSAEVAERLMVSQPKISHLENGNRAISPRDVRDLCAVYAVTDQQVVEALMQMAKESGQQGWWHAYGDIPQSAYIALETDAASLHAYESMVIPALLQTPAYANAVIEKAIPQLTAEQTGMRLKVLRRRQHRICAPDCPLRLSVVVDESALRRVVGGPEVMREQLQHLNALGTEPHVTVQVLPHTVGAHPCLSGQFSILKFAENPGAVVYLERFSNDLYLKKPSDVQHYSVMFEYLQALALSPDNSHSFITDVTKVYIDTASRR
ncbi:helix-turn-helix transcriptional regulator [Streptomyces sp. NPDC005132]|uniref:helix-turn-helix domain-containing protein n=1 Tax=Streptomyces sp. NPDC005132 TaxID=3154294 RepID=UPI0033B79A6E